MAKRRPGWPGPQRAASGRYPCQSEAPAQKAPNLNLHAVIPTHDPDPARLEAAVGSAVRVPGMSRVWVVDDGSARPIEQSSVLTDTRVTLLRQENAGPSSARNAGLEAACELSPRADAVVLLDDDDELIADGVGAMLRLADELGASAVVAAREQVYRSADGERTEVKAVPSEWADRALPRAGDVFTPISLFGASGCLVAGPALRAGVRFDVDLWIGEDRDFLRRCAGTGPIGVCAQQALRYTKHGRGEANLTGSAHLARRVKDHLTLLDRHYEASHDGIWKEATVWLLNQIAKNSSGLEAKPLLEACAHRGWRLPLKTRWRLKVKGWRV